ncbi:MAG TPA: CRISPR-associated helicase Cas3' [Planctomycetales bacterium]|nr:CRISPR-associated helicase Cas3' [Planctomycetales bacterium]
MTFTDLFNSATCGEQKPFPYQIAFAESGNLPELVHAPTGSGKTATAILGWLWRYFHSEKPTPRRLVYCLPMRVLVEQTRDEALKWLKNLELLDKVKVHVLMGGEDAEEWDLEPEKPAILIGTQDMLLSRALNRGYGMGRFRWPMHYGLLNNDCLWVLDEIQLMGTGLATSTQLQAFRESLTTFGTAKTVWMSATLLPRWLASVDFRDRIEPGLRLSKLQLDPKADYEADGLRERWIAAKPLAAANLAADDIAEVAQFVKDKHKDGSLTLVIVNKVDRCRALFEAIRNLYQPPKPKGRGKNVAQSAPAPSPDLKLIHSRFRPIEREGWRGWLTQDPEKLRQEHPLGRIVVSTQVVEAGVDMSAQTLITELAPWPSLVQRFGRCNRRGEFLADNPAQVFWVDVLTPDDKKAAPYSKVELDEARERIGTIPDVGLKSLTEFFDGLGEAEREKLFPFDPAHVIRRKDFIDLFDTTPDLAGNDIDVSRFIRDGDDLDVQVFWRTEGPPADKLRAKDAKRIAPQRWELCPVPIGQFREFVERVKKAGKIKTPAYRWDALDGKWVPTEPDFIFPGQVFWLPANVGGYSKELGWKPDAPPLPAADCHHPTEVYKLTEGEGKDDDLASQSHAWQLISEHTDDVARFLDGILGKLELPDLPREALKVAARWHDWGKRHFVFQAAVKDGQEGDPARPAGWESVQEIAKAPTNYWRWYKRKHFRHELASALGVLTLLNYGETPKLWAELAPYLQDLALYLIAAHHGKVRLSIRSMPNETTPNKLFARGVWQDDELPGVDLGDGVTAPHIEKLDLSPMLLGRVDGRASWVERMLGLRDHKEFGPLRLAYLETVLRAADIRASKAADGRAKGVQS